MNATLVNRQLNSKDQAVAVVEGGRDNNMEVFLHTGDCCDNCGPSCTKYDRCCKDCMMCHKPDARVFQSKHFDIQDGKFFPLPKAGEGDLASERGYVFGPTGLGKSVFCEKYSRYYQALYPRREIYLVSYVEEDKSLDGVKGLIRIPIQDIMEGQLGNIQALAESLIIFDDIDAMPSLEKDSPYKPKDVFTTVLALRDQILTKGRHYQISTLVTSHLGADHQNTKKVLDSASFFVFFPNGNAVQNERVMRNYGGIELQPYKRMKDLPSRWVYLNRGAPKYVIFERGIYLI